METSYPAKLVEKLIRSKACAHYLLLYAVFNSLNWVTRLHIISALVTTYSVAMTTLAYEIHSKMTYHFALLKNKQGYS